MGKELTESRLLRLPKLDDDDHSVPTQADGKSRLDIVGQTEFIAVKNNVSLHWSGYVAKTLSADILCGAPFMEQNRIVQELHNKRIVVDGKYHFLEDSPFRPVSVSSIENTSSPTSSISIGSSVPKNIKEKLNSIHVHHSHIFDGDLSVG